MPPVSASRSVSSALRLQWFLGTNTENQEQSVGNPTDCRGIVTEFGYLLDIPAFVWKRSEDGEAGHGGVVARFIRSRTEVDFARHGTQSSCGKRRRSRTSTHSGSHRVTGRSMLASTVCGWRFLKFLHGPTNGRLPSVIGRDLEIGLTAYPTAITDLPSKFYWQWWNFLPVDNLGGAVVTQVVLVFWFTGLVCCIAMVRMGDSGGLCCSPDVLVSRYQPTRLVIDAKSKEIFPTRSRVLPVSK